MNEILQIESVGKIFRTGFFLKPVQVLYGISLAVKAGSVFGFLGANGAGKTTLIHLIAGIKNPSKGAIKIKGFTATSLEAKMRTGYLPERPYFHDHLTGEGLLRYFGVLSGMPQTKLKSRISEVLEIVGMSHAKKFELKKYSKGMLQRIGIAQAILHDPELLVLDEPMSGLDPLGRKEMRELILRLAGEGRTIFFSSHVIPDVEAICDEVGIIHKGKLVGCGAIGNFLAKGPIQTEIAFSGITKEQASSIKEFDSFREMPDGIRALVPGQDAATAVLSKLLGQGAKILWVTPVRPSLELLFEQGTLTNE